MARSVAQCAGRTGYVWLCIMVFALCGAAPSSEAESKAPSGPVRSVRLPFRSDGGQSALTAGRYVYLPSDGTDGVGRLVNDETSETWAVPPASGCPGGLTGAANAGGVSVIGTGWLVGRCAQTERFELYALPSGPWRALTPPPDCRDASAESNCGPSAVGQRWIALTYVCYHCATRVSYENIATGVERTLTLSRRQAVDLSSPTLERTVCSPLKVPTHGTLTFDGQYAVADARQGAFLERCDDARLRERLARATEQLTFNSRALLWLSSENSTSAILRGMVLATRRVFEIRLPSAIAVPGVHTLSMTPRHIYIFAAHVISPRDYVPRLYVANLPGWLRVH